MVLKEIVLDQALSITVASQDFLTVIFNFISYSLHLEPNPLDLIMSGEEFKKNDLRIENEVILSIKTTMINLNSVHLLMKAYT